MAELQGIIRKILELKVVSEKFKKQEFIIQTVEEYPQIIVLEFQQEKVNLLKEVSVGQLVSVSYSLQGREVNIEDKLNYFITAKAWKIAPIK